MRRGRRSVARIELRGEIVGGTVLFGDARIVAIDIETGEFEVGDDPLAASDQLFVRCPDAQPWLVRIGHQAVHRFGRSYAGSAI